MPLDGVFENLALPAQSGGHVWTLRGSGTRLFHRHAELELNLGQSGHAVYLVGSERVRLTRRSLLWLHPAQNHILIETSRDFSMRLAVWKPAFLQSACQSESSQILLRDDPKLARCKRIGEDDFAALDTLFSRLEHSSGELLESGLGFLLHLAQVAFEGAGESARGSAVHPCVERAARLLRDRVPPPSVPELAREVGLSPSRLSRLFKLQTGVSLTAFRSAQCHERALDLLAGDLPLSEVSIRAGFGSYAQFHRVFGERSGANPARLRKNWTERQEVS